MHLMLLERGGLSLEFATDDFTRIGQAMRELGDVECEEGAAHMVYRVDGAKLLYQSEWDDPCLIAGDEESIRVLRALFDRLVDQNRVLLRAA